MNEEKKRKITKNFGFIKHNIEAKQLIDHFIEEGIFSISKAQELFSNTETIENRNHSFLMQLMRSKPRAYDVFIEALEKNQCGFVAETIKNTHVDKCECMMDEEAKRPRPVPAFRKSIQAKKDVLKHEMEDAKNAISSLESENKKMKNEMESVQMDRYNDISSLRSEMQSVQMDKDNDITYLQSENRKLTNEMESVQRDTDIAISSLESENKKMKNEMHYVQRDRDNAISSLQSENKMLKNIMETVQKDTDIAISSLRSEMQSVQMDKDNAITYLQSENRKLTNEMESVQRDTDIAISFLESENKKMKNEIESVQRDRDNAISSLQSEMESVQRDKDNAISSIESENKKMKNEMHYVQRDKDNAISSLQSENKMLKNIMETVQRDTDIAFCSLESENRNLTNEMESVQRDRAMLSVFIELKLADNDSSIAHLWNKNGYTTRLTEKYAELYNVHFHDALEILMAEGTDKGTSVRVLLTIVKRSFKVCQQKTDNEMKQMDMLVYSRGIRETTQLTEENKKLLEVCKTAAAVNAKASIHKRILVNLRKGHLWKYAQPLEDFVEKCAELFWMMCVQDPPLALGPEPRPGHNFDETYYMYETGTETSVQNIVWLPLLLHKDGPILYRGVIQ